MTHLLSLLFLYNAIYHSHALLLILFIRDYLLLGTASTLVPSYPEALPFSDPTELNKSDISYLKEQPGLRTFRSIQVLSWQLFLVS